jgi:hypothetical protein
MDSLIEKHVIEGAKLYPGLKRRVIADQAAREVARLLRSSGKSDKSDKSGKEEVIEVGE